jgi:hypothetical protein
MRPIPLALAYLLATLASACQSTGAGTQHPVQAPGPVSAAAIAYDDTDGVTLLFGGLLAGAPEGVDAQQLWAWDGNTWTARSFNGPTLRSHGAMAYDSGRHVALLLGGVDPSAAADACLPDGGDSGGCTCSTWTIGGPSGQGTQELGCIGNFIGLRDHQLVYDAAHQVVMEFGGTSDGQHGTSLQFQWDGQQWSLSNNQSVVVPPARFAHAMSYDAARKRTVLFGGTPDGSLAGALGDTWEWDGATWTLEAPHGGSPPARAWSAMVYDSARHVSVLFGGLGEEGILDDTWEWDGKSWTQVATSGGPPPSYQHMMAFDSRRNVTVLVGGVGDLQWPSGTWEWDGSSWRSR